MAVKRSECDALLMITHQEYSELASVIQGESHYEEEKEIIQKQLKIERDELLVICQQHQVTSSLSVLCTRCHPVTQLTDDLSDNEGLPP